MRLSMLNAQSHACTQRSRVWRACGSSRRATGPCIARRGRHSHLRVQAIGFDFGDNDGGSRGAPPTKRGSKINSLGVLASSLLVYGHVMKGAVGEAYLAALAVTQKYQATGKEVLSAYGRFYGLLLTAGYDNFQDYILDQILLGRDNAFARAVAQGTLEPGAPVLRAVAYDLDVLQDLALPLPQVAEMIADAAPASGPYWLEGASSISIKRAKKGALPAGSGALEDVIAIDPHTPSQFIGRPPSEQELAAWKAAISGKDAWGEAVPLLQQYYHLHGFGITSRNSTLRWVKGAFEEGPDGSAAASLAPLSVLDAPRAALDANTAAHCEGRPAHHVLVAGPSGSGKSSLLWDYTLAAGKDRGLRLVDVSGAELGNILEVARGCGRYPRLRFVLVADHVDFPVRGAAAAELCSGLSGSGPSGWPANTLLYMGASASSALSYDAVVNRFGLILTTKELDAEGFATTLRQVAGEDGAKLTDEDVAYAAEWAKKQAGGLSIRSAVHYVRRAHATS